MARFVLLKDISSNRANLLGRVRGNCATKDYIPDTVNARYSSRCRN